MGPRGGPDPLGSARPFRIRRGGAVSRSPLTGWVLAAVAALVVPVAADGRAAAEPASPEAPVASYGALGDSYTAGPLIPVQTGQPAGCQRSDHNYPSLVAETLGVAGFTDV